MHLSSITPLHFFFFFFENQITIVDFVRWSLSLSLSLSIYIYIVFLYKLFVSSMKLSLLCFPLHIPKKKKKTIQFIPRSMPLSALLQYHSTLIKNLSLPFNVNPFWTLPTIRVRVVVKELEIIMEKDQKASTKVAQ